jgi:hypothetical protein
MKTKVVLGIFLFFNMYMLHAQEYSKLWGVNGEKWVPGYPLQDFTKAGYHEGKDPFPRWPVKINVKDFGAAGDGKADETEAFRKAIEACPANGAVFIPVGTYKITDWLRFSDKSNIIIRGEDMYETELIFPNGLEDIHSSPSMTTSGIPTTRYSWGGGFIWFDNADELGIENLTFRFPDVTYPGHFYERGYNMIQLSGKNCWVRNVRGYNADSGIFLRGSYTTLRNILLDAFPDRTRTDSRARAGHHAIDIQGGKHNLVENYTETIKFIHSLGSEGSAQWNVWCRCKGPDIEIDHHTTEADIEHNLFTDIDMGRGQGAEGQRRIQTGMYETFWNLRSSQVIPLDPTGADIKQGIPIFPDNINYIVVGWNLGWPESEKEKRFTSFPWYEYIRDYDDIHPPNIYIAQVKKRMGVDNLPPEVMITRPLDKAVFPPGKAITVTAIPDDRDGSVEQVELYVHGVRQDEVLKSKPYQWTLPEMSPETYYLTVLARDNQGATSIDTVTIVVR